MLHGNGDDFVLKYYPRQINFTYKKFLCFDGEGSFNKVIAVLLMPQLLEGSSLSSH